MPFTILFILDFPVWTVQLFESALKTRDVLVQLGGRVVARSERLRAEGVARGWSIERARARFPEAQVRLHPGPRIRLAWDLALAWIHTLTPWMESGLHANFVHRPGDASTRRDVEALAEEGIAVLNLGKGVDASRVAHRLRARIGIAGDRASAWLAAMSAGPTSVLDVCGEEESFRRGLPIHWLATLGIGIDTLERLAWLGFHTVGQIARMTPLQLQAQFSEGRALSALLHERDTRTVQPFVLPPSIRAEYEAPEPMLEPAEWEPVLHHLSTVVVKRLSGEQPPPQASFKLPLPPHNPIRATAICELQQQAQMVTVGMTGNRQVKTSRRISHAPTSEFQKIWPLAQLAARDASATIHHGIDHISVTLEGLVRPTAHQELLWDEKRASLERAVAEVERRQPGTSLRVVGFDADAYLPEEAFQLVPVTVVQRTRNRP